MPHKNNYLFGISMNTSSHLEKVVSGLGGFVAIFLVFWITNFFEGVLQANLLFLASMGATAVLLFAAPLGPLSQPWNVIGGHIISAIIGVMIHQLISDQYIAGALAVGIAITAMYYLRCLHPPGGATALAAVIGGTGVDSLGILYVLIPVGLSAALMVLVAVIFNYPFSWRRYPAALHISSDTPRFDSKSFSERPAISHADFVAALVEIDSFVDISEHDLLRIYEIATKRHHPELSSSENDGALKEHPPTG